MSQKNPSDAGQKGFAVGRGLLAAAETLNFSMNEQRSGPPSRPMGGMVSSMGGGVGDSQDRSSQLSRRGGGSHLGSTMKLFASLGLSPADLDALAQIPEEDISVETLPHILMQLKSRKGDSGDRRITGNPRDLSSMSPETSYRGGREDWDNMHMGRMGGPSMGQASSRAPPQSDFGYGSMQDTPSSRGYDLDYGNNNSGGNRERGYSELSHRDSYGGLDMGPSPSEPVFMQRRMGSPSHGKIQDFLGAMPPMFPHVCSLCDFDVHSTMEWNQHTNGLRHAENRRLLLQMYPDWDPSMASSRGGGSHLLETPNLSAGILGPAPMSTGQTPVGLSSNWGGGHGFSGKTQSHAGQAKMRSRVVVAKYDRKPLSNKSLFSFTEPFGVLREHLILNNKAFLEMDTHQEALDMVNYYKQHQATLYGKPVTFYLSKELMVIEKDNRSGDGPNREVKGHGSQVVFFSNLPWGEEKKMELLTVAKRFGTVEKHLFLTDEAFVQLGTPEDAEMLVKYYTLNPLTIKGRSIRLNICTKYKTLNVNRRGGQGVPRGDGRGRKPSNSSAAKPSFKNSSSKSASSSSKSRDEKKKEEARPESEEEVAGVVEADSGEEEEEREESTAKDRDKETEDSEVQASVDKTESEQTATEEVPESNSVPREEVSGREDITEGADGDMEGAETEGQTAPMETEGSQEEAEAQDELTTKPGEISEMEGEQLEEDLEGSMDEKFLENMDDFVTLDELAEDEDGDGQKSDSCDKSRKGGMRVVNIVGFRRGYGFLNELLALAKPFGKVVKHLVLDLRPEAYLQFATEDEAKAMAKFYNSNVTASVCGKPVRICHSQTYPTIQCGASRVVYVGQIPNVKYSDGAILKLSEEFGKVKKYFLNRIKRECFIEMENAEDAENMAETYKANPPKFQGKRLTVYVSRKYKQLKYGHRCPSAPEEKKALKRDGSSASQSTTEEPPLKKLKEEKQEEGQEKKGDEMEVKKVKGVETEKEVEEDEKQMEETEESAEVSSSELKSVTDPTGTEEKDLAPSSDASENIKTSEVDVTFEEAEASTDQNQGSGAEQDQQTEPEIQMETKPIPASLPLPLYDPNNPIGTEYVKMGYYCRVCFLFYSNEDTAKKAHCSSQAHYDKLQKHLEKEKAKGQANRKGKKPSA
ncbi:matrin 3-like 1.2 [Lampris incognitus]|uniref:matrin 3-like 1.2 n=1 Tax=Lampris incognitus TaxID=2546036 RepID=UPI0024B4E150|nr:matrin 3-like 1.2 [Lampris incognitus]